MRQEYFVCFFLRISSYCHRHHLQTNCTGPVPENFSSMAWSGHLGRFAWLSWPVDGGGLAIGFLWHKRTGGPGGRPTGLVGGGRRGGVAGGKTFFSPAGGVGSDYCGCRGLQTCSVGRCWLFVVCLLLFVVCCLLFLLLLLLLLMLLLLLLLLVLLLLLLVCFFWFFRGGEKRGGKKKR